MLVFHCNGKGLAVIFLRSFFLVNLREGEPSVMGRISQEDSIPQVPPWVTTL